MVAKAEGPIQGVAKKGFDVPYEQQHRALAAELEATLAGPKNRKPVAPDDTEMKNPDGQIDASGTAVPKRP